MTIDVNLSDLVRIVAALVESGWEVIELADIDGCPRYLLEKHGHDNLVVGPDF